jgi:hypothetical protein
MSTKRGFVPAVSLSSPSMAGGAVRRRASRRWLETDHRGDFQLRLKVASRAPPP